MPTQKLFLGLFFASLVLSQGVQAQDLATSLRCTLTHEKPLPEQFEDQDVKPLSSLKILHGEGLFVKANQVYGHLESLNTWIEARDLESNLVVHVFFEEKKMTWENYELRELYIQVSDPQSRFDSTSAQIDLRTKGPIQPLRLITQGRAVNVDCFLR